MNHNIYILYLALTFVNSKKIYFVMRFLKVEWR